MKYTKIQGSQLNEVQFKALESLFLYRDAGLPKGKNKTVVELINNSRESKARKVFDGLTKKDIKNAIKTSELTGQITELGKGLINNFKRDFLTPLNEIGFLIEEKRTITGKLRKEEVFYFINQDNYLQIKKEFDLRDRQDILLDHPIISKKIEGIINILTFLDNSIGWDMDQFISEVENKAKKSRNKRGWETELVLLSDKSIVSSIIKNSEKLKLPKSFICYLIDSGIHDKITIEYTENQGLYLKVDDFPKDYFYSIDFMQALKFFFIEDILKARNTTQKRKLDDTLNLVNRIIKKMKEEEGQK